MGPLECITNIDAVQQKVWHGLRMSKAMSSNINLQISILLRKVPSEKLHWKTIYIYTHTELAESWFSNFQLMFFLFWGVCFHCPIPHDEPITQSLSIQPF